MVAVGWWWPCRGGGRCGCGLIVAVWGVFGDAACHVIGVGTCCPNVPNHMWAGSSAVKRVLYCYRKRSGVRISQKTNVFFAPI